MRKVTCASCGRPYDYDSDDFCPKCGSYNPLLLHSPLWIISTAFSWEKACL